MDQRHQMGKDAETQAVEWFLAKGNYKLLARNYRCRWGEIDLIFEMSSSPPISTELVFVEVRARAPRPWMDSLQGFSKKKQRRLKRTSAHFLLYYRGPAQTLRFDFVYRDGGIWMHLPHLELDEANAIGRNFF